ncbi:MAG: protein kinase [Myxococcota bacterium]
MRSVFPARRGDHRTSGGLTSSHDSAHPDDEQLAAYVDGALDSAAVGRLERHLVACSRCALVAGYAWTDPSEGSGADRLRSAVLPAFVASPDLAPGEQVGRYRIERRLGAGAMGTVYRAEDTKLDREVALKCLHVRGDADPEATRARLLSEARALARLEDPRVVQIFDVGIHEGTFFLVMQLVDGQSLRVWASRASQAELLAAMAEAAGALEAVHRAGLLHGDFKPDNVMVGADGRVFVLDFGLARAIADQRTTGAASGGGTGTGGTPAYMGPELLAGGRPTPHADQYAWSVTLFELLCNRRPFAATSLSQLREDARRAAVAWPTDPPLPRRIARVLARGMAARPESRWPSVAEASRRLVRRRSSGASAVVLAAAAAVAVAAAPGAKTTGPVPGPWDCEQPGAVHSPTWDDAEAAALRQRLIESKMGSTAADDVVAVVQSQVDRWSKQWRRVCTPDPFAQTTAHQCLRDVRQQIDHAVDLLREGEPETLARALPLLQRLGNPRHCTDRSDVSDEGPLARELRDTLARVEVLRSAGEHRQAHDMALEVADRAGNASLDRIFGRAALQVAGTSSSAEDDPEQRLQWLHRAYETAVAAGDDPTAARAATSLVLQTTRARELPAAHRWAEQARVLAERSGSVATLGALDKALSELLRSEGRYEEALVPARRAVERSVAIDGDPSPSAGLARVAVGNTLIRLGRYDEAVAVMERAVSDLGSGRAPREVAIANAVSAIAAAELYRGHHAVAARKFRRVRSIYARIYGQDHRRMAPAETNLGLALLQAGGAEEGMACLQHALAITRRVHGETDYRLVPPLINVGRGHSMLGHHDEAIAILWSAVELARDHGGESDPEYATALETLADAHYFSGQPARALRFKTEALELRVAQLGADHPTTRKARVALQQMEDAVEGPDSDARPTVPAH